ncbi:uncharacterized protein JCM15063_004042 [Sporobolomyces koalae]|uniref:uncharacterized protein n=1 Tax=Sporobolomyces koalae TaxID=500713 RepID=UPI00316B4270
MSHASNGSGDNLSDHKRSDQKYDRKVPDVTPPGMRLSDSFAAARRGEASVEEVRMRKGQRRREAKEQKQEEENQRKWLKKRKPGKEILRTDAARTKLIRDKAHRESGSAAMGESKVRKAPFAAAARTGERHGH